MLKKISLLKKCEPFLYILPCLLLTVLFVYYPFIKTIISSLFFINKEGVLRRFAGVTNYMDVFQDADFYKALVNSLIFTLISVPTNLILSLIFALLANQKSLFNRFSSVVFIIPMAISVSIAAMIFNIMLNPTIGAFDYIFNSGIAWFTDEKYALLGVVILSGWLSIGFNYVFFTSAIRNVPGEMLESASLEGANWFKKLIYIVLPMISPTVFFLFCTSIIGGLMMVGPVLVLTKGGPNMSTTTLIYQMYIKAYQSGNYGYSFALSVIIFFFVGSLLCLIFKFEKKGVYYN